MQKKLKKMRSTKAAGQAAQVSFPHGGIDLLGLGWAQPQVWSDAFLDERNRC
jgi:hypothetical protein